MEQNAPFLIVSDYLPADGSRDVSGQLQRLIDENPNRTLYFPDGVYLLRHPVLTPADPKKSVALRLANYAVIKAAPGWDSPEAMLRLGAKDFANDIRTPGSNYSLSGGILDGSGIASGVSIDGGRETRVRDVSMKQVRIGLHIKYGANACSSDCDISDVNIVGSGARDSIGVLLEGHDNTLTNMRIADVFTGVDLRSGGNSLRNIHPLYTCDYTGYGESCGFYDENGNNWFNFCYSDHFATGFRMAEGRSSIYDSCFCMWYCARGERHTAVKADGAFDAVMTNLRVGFFNNETENVLLEEGRPNGTGVFERILVNTDRTLTGDAYAAYLRNGLKRW